jgi:hypothetical protein
MGLLYFSQLIKKVHACKESTVITSMSGLMAGVKVSERYPSLLTIPEQYDAPISCRLSVNFYLHQRYVYKTN